ncbi:MAG: hypothetical protein ABEI52_02970, partial [Halobacteriaceae archaeon]
MTTDVSAIGLNAAAATFFPARFRDAARRIRALSQQADAKYVGASTEEHEHMVAVLKEIPVESWEELFGDELVVSVDFAPNIHVKLVFSDGEVVSTKGSWAFLQRSLFCMHQPHRSRK